MLKGIRVLDLSRVIAGPYCAALMGDLGADVIKLERPGRGDDLRNLRGSGQMSASFAAMNRNKRGIAVDLQRPEGVRLAFELARRADVLVENFLPGVTERLGLGYAAVRAANPAIVYASITGFGQTGPLARKAGYNTIAQGMSGLMALTGMPGHPPTRVAGSVSDVAASYMAFGMINAALVHRFRTGEGQQVDVSLLASSLGLLPDPVAIYFDTGERPKRAGNRNLHLTPAEAFQGQDGLINIVLLNPDQWKRFCGALGDEAMETDPRFATNDARLAHHAEFKARVEAILATAPVAAVGRAARGRHRRGGARLRVPRGVRGPAGPPPRAGGGDGAAGRRPRAHSRVPRAGVGDAAPHHTPGAAPRSAHGGGARRARALARGDRPARRGRRHRAGPRRG